MDDDSEIDIPLPSPSYWPIILALGMTLVGIGVVSIIYISLLGLIVILVATAGWTLENRAGAQGEDHE
jgi:cytochrome c oxidase subunit I